MSTDAPYLFTVVIPVYNRVKRLQRAVESVHKQTCKDFEIIVVDDGSDHAHKEAIKSAIGRYNKARYRLISYENNVNGAFARNIGIKNATGEYVCFLDSDDEWKPDKLAVIAQIIEQKKVAFIYHQCLTDAGQLIPSRGLEKNERLTDYMFIHHNKVGAPTSTISIKRSIALSFLFDENLKGHQDWDFCLRLEMANIPFYFVNQALALRHKSSADSVGNGIRLAQSLSFFERYKPSFSLYSSMFFMQRVIMPKAEKELMVFSYLRVSPCFWLSFLFIPQYAFPNFFRNWEKVRSLKKRLQSVKTAVDNNYMVIYGDNYYGKILKKWCADRVVAIIDTKPKNAFIDGMPVQRPSDFAKRSLDDFQYIVLATDEHGESMQVTLAQLGISTNKNILQF